MDAPRYMGSLGQAANAEVPLDRLKGGSEGIHVWLPYAVLGVRHRERDLDIREAAAVTCRGG
jgi:hypothetical protein